MEKDINKLKSEYLSKEVELISYGRYGIAMIIFPTQGDSCHDAENIGFVHTLKDYINSGRVKVYSVSSVNLQSWLDSNKTDEERSRRHYEYNRFLEEELVPYIYETCGGPVPMMTMGAAIGSYHAANTFFRRPDIFMGTIALSGFYDIRKLTKGFFDENCYFNSPVDYLPNLNDNYWMSYLLNRKHIYLASGSGRYETPEQTKSFSDILNAKGIRHRCDLWDTKWDHDSKTWNEQLKHITNSFL
ncbi:MAG: hypothetical protein KGZ71_00185 [Desulfobulbaceae bacterium]|nr:esterase [Candidatus Kapabacteria bacterium]MBS3998877.1 hypothetical protein [Desulfobulbaceae bacterium]